MSIFDPIYRGVAAELYEMMNGDKPPIKKARYYAGEQDKQLKTAPGKTDDNIIVNLVGLAVDRSISHVLAGGVKFATPEGADAQQEYLDNVWDVNRRALLLTNAGLQAGIQGTGYLKIVPDGLTDPYIGAVLPRLIVLDPEYMTIETEPLDAEKVIRYVWKCKIGETTYREITRRSTALDYGTDKSAPEEPQSVPDTWIIENWHIDAGGKWVLDKLQEFPYNFPPIVHWKNLPSIKSVYGSSDLDDILGIQDKDNFVKSNIQKMVRLQAHKQLWDKNTGADKLDIGPDKIVHLHGDTADIGVLDIQSDITGSIAFSHDLRQSLFDVAREVDITSITDKLGALTNFGLRVLYSDALSKTNIKRDLLGEALLEINRRLLVLSGQEGEASRPGTIAWKDPLPSNITEELAADAIALSNKIVDTQTVYERYADRYGQTWEEVQARMQGAQQAQGQNDLGTMLLRMKEFNIGGQNNQAEKLPGQTNQPKA